MKGKHTPYRNVYVSRDDSYQKILDDGFRVVYVQHWTTLIRQRKMLQLFGYNADGTQGQRQMSLSEWEAVPWTLPKS